VPVAPVGPAAIGAVTRRPLFADQVLVHGEHVLVGRDHGLERHLAGRDEPAQEGVEGVGVAGRGEQAADVVVDADGHHVVLADERGGQRLRGGAADEDLEGVDGLHVPPHGADRALGDDVAAGEHDHALAHLLDLVQDVARDDHDPVARRQLGHQRHRVDPRHRVEPVQRLVQQHDQWVVGDGLGQLRPLAHPLGVRSQGAVPGLPEADVEQRLVGALEGRPSGQARQLRHQRDEAHGRRVGEVGLVLGHEPDRRPDGHRVAHHVAS